VSTHPSRKEGEGGGDRKERGKRHTFKMKKKKKNPGEKKTFLLSYYSGQKVEKGHSKKDSWLH